MKLQRIKSFRFLLGFFLPVAGVALLAGVLNLISFANLREEYRQTSAHEVQDAQQIKEIARINQNMAQIQIDVGDTLELAAAPKADQAQIYRFHSDLVNRLAVLQKELDRFPDDSAYTTFLMDAREDFQNYKNFIIRATDLAAVDPVGAMRQAFAAAQAHVRVAEHTQSIASAIATEMAGHSRARATAFEAQAVQTGLIGAAMMALVLLLWLVISERVTRRLTQVSEALSAFAQDDITPPTLPLVTQLSQQKNSLLRDMAVSVLAFRDSVISRNKAQYDLGERIKEVSCLYEVKALTEDPQRDIREMLNAVVQRLPAAMRYPEMAVAWIDYQGRRYGSRAAGETMRVGFGGTAAQPDWLGMTYTAPLQADAGEPFLAEEHALLEAIGKRLTDVIERRRNASALAQADRALLTARLCAKALIQAEDEDQLMADICHLAVEVGGYRMAWVGMAENDAACSVRPVASVGFQDNFLETLQISWADEALGHGPVGTAIRELRTVVMRDFLTNPSFAPWREVAVQHGFAALIALPLLLDNQRCFGALILHTKEADAFSATEVEQLNELANDLSFGLRTLRTRAALAAQNVELSKLSLVVAQNPNAIVITDLQSNIEYVNDAFVRNTGFRREDVLGKNPRLLQSGQTPLATYQDMWQTLVSAKTWTGEFINHTREGAQRIEAAIIIPLIQRDGQVSHYVAIKEDITDKRAQEDQLRKLYLAVEQSPESIVITNLDAQIEYVNAAFTRVTGYSREEALGLNPRVLQSGRTPKATYGAMWEALVRGEGWRGELINKRKDGSEYLELATMAPISQPDGRITHYLAIKEDITDKKRMSDELDRYRLNLEELVTSRTAALDAALQEQNAVFEAASVGIVLLRDRVIVRCNHRMEEMFGYAPGEQIGQPTRSLYPDDASYLEIGQIISSQSIQGQVIGAESKMVRKDGTPFWVRMSGRVIESGELAGGMVGIFEDMTAERAAMDEIRQAHALAEAANRSKSEFLANMSHEIRTPMNAIIGMSYLALQTGLDKKQRNYIDKVHRSGENLLRIINDILDFSKIEAGKLSMEATDFNLDTVMDSLSQMVSLKTEDKGLELHFQIAAGVPNGLVGDPLRLGQVLVNLGNNAVKFTERGEIVVGIDTVAEHDDGVELHFWVRDTGIGMTPEQCDKMFQSFSQADASTTRKYGGTGLGLAICKNLVQLMRGKIWVESVAGQGSTFHFHARFGVHANPQNRRMFQADELMGVRVLLVDDNATSREILSVMVKTFGLEVDVASGGAQALQLVTAANQRNQPYDLVLTDWKMPAMDGIELVRQLQSKTGPTTPAVVMVSAYGRDDALGAAQQQQVDIRAVLTKPVTPSSLLEAIGEALHKGGAAPSTVKRADGGALDAMAQLKGARVLLVEDNDMNQELAMELLRQAQMQVVLAGNGQEALDILAKDSRFDGILMDCQMPVMDGYTATRALRKNPVFKDLPIIAMTANAMAGDKEKVLEAGMQDHIAKPLNVGLMFATLARWIHPAGGAGAVDAADTAGAASAAATTPDATNSVAACAMNTGARGLFDAISLAGIDTRFGLATALNNEALYRRLLRKFRDGQENFADLFAQAQAQSQAGPDTAAAQRCAHTLSGTAATVGAKQVQAAAAQLELACKQQAPQAQIDALLQAVLAELMPVMASLKALGNEDSGPNTSEPSASEPNAPAPSAENLRKLEAVRARLLELLDQGDSAAMDLCDEHADLLQAAYPGQWAKIAQLVQNFDFEAALTRLQESNFSYE